MRVPGRDRVRAALRERGIATAVLYTPPIHLQSVYRGLGLGAGSFPVAEALARDLLCLPMHAGLSDMQVDEVASALMAACESDVRAARRVLSGDRMPIHETVTRT